MSLTGHVALITGANHGIGRSTAELLADHGASVLLTYLRTDAAKSYPDAYRENRRLNGDDVARTIIEAGGTAIAIEADLLKAETVPMLFDTAERDLGPIDILVNNATGHCAHDSFGNVAAVRRNVTDIVTADVFDKTFGVDARAGALLIAEFARRHIARGADWGRLVSLTSGGPMGFPGEVTYGAAKAALENYTKAASIELGPHGITANVLYPPVTDTGWVTDEVRDFVQRSSDHIHVAEPIDVARVIVWLCSDEARMVTGNTIRLR